MKQRGYLEGSHMANAFNMLRPNDLIWPYVVNVYMKGQAPFPFDLLYWNSDSTRMPAANHAFYLRNCYLENKLAKGEMEIGGVRLDLQEGEGADLQPRGARKTTSRRPARSSSARRPSAGRSIYVLAGSGHIAGVVNPATKPKYQYLDRRPGRRRVRGLDRRRQQEKPGSWWPYWFAWIEKQAPKRVPAREPAAGKLRRCGRARDLRAERAVAAHRDGLPSA